MKKLIKIISLIIIPILIATSVSMFYNNYLDNKIAKQFDETLLSIYSYNIKDKGIEALKRSAEKNDLIILGSSELSTNVPQNPARMFPNTQLNANVSLVGRAHVQSLLDAIKIGALSDSFKNKKLVLIVSLQWFLNEDISKEGFQANFSELQFYETMNNPKISDEVKKYICERTSTLVENVSSLERPNLYSTLYEKDNIFSDSLLTMLKPNYIARNKILLLKDKHELYKLIGESKSKPNNTVLNIDWNEQEILAHKMGEEACTNNEFCVDDSYYTKYLEPRLEELKDSSKNIDLMKSKEFNDYEVLLQICQQVGVQPYIVFMPTNGLYYDYIGITKDKRTDFYNKLGTLASKYGCNYLDLREKEYEPYFLKDVMHLGWKGWLYVNKQITEYYS